MENNNPAGSGGGNTPSAPLGAVPVGGNASPGNTPSSNPNAPQVIELSEDSMVRLPGAKDPVRYGDHNRGFQSEFTKRAQEAKRYREQAENYKREVEDYKRRASQVPQQGQVAKPNPGAELTTALKSLSYLSGEDAAKVVEHLTGQFGQLEQQLQKRDYAIGLLYNQLKQMGTTVSTLGNQHSQGQFESKISNFMKTVGVPTELTDWVKETYLAYEGEDLDREFPGILKTRFDQLQNHFKATERKRVDEARRLPFVPGKGGNSSPSKPLQDFSKKSARDIAEAMWPGVDGDVET